MMKAAHFSFFHRFLSTALHVRGLHIDEVLQNSTAKVNNQLEYSFDTMVDMTKNLLFDAVLNNVQKMQISCFCCTENRKGFRNPEIILIMFYLKMPHTIMRLKHLKMHIQLSSSFFNNVNNEM